MAKILVTGANGYIGKHVVNYMKKNNVDFVGTDYHIDAKCKKDILFIKSDIFTEDDLFEKAGKPEIILHLAWRNGFIHNDNSHMSDLSSHFNFLTKMIEKGVKQICIMGSMHEVGYYEGAIDENTPTNPMSQYAIAKNALRQSMELYCKNNNVIFQWIRGFYIFGDDLGGNSIFAKLQQANADGKKRFPFTTGKNKYDFLSIDELAKQITSVVTQKEITGIINCCSGKPVSLSEQVEWYIKENKLNIELEYGVFPDRKYDSPAIWGNNKKIKKLLGEDFD